MSFLAVMMICFHVHGVKPRPLPDPYGNLIEMNPEKSCCLCLFPFESWTRTRLKASLPAWWTMTTSTAGRWWSWDLRTLCCECAGGWALWETRVVTLCLSCCSEGGFFRAILTFPSDYPLRPPKMKFISQMWHPNGESCHAPNNHGFGWSRSGGHDSLCAFIPVAKNGEVCISILHEPGEDKYGYERPEERWLPIHTVETIMISVISMLADPNGDSPANVDAAVSSHFEGSGSVCGHWGAAVSRGLHWR